MARLSPYLEVYVRGTRGVYRGKVVNVARTALTAKYYECYGGFCRRSLLIWHRGKWYHDEAPYFNAEKSECHRKGPHPHRWKPLPKPRRLQHGKGKGRTKKARGKAAPRGKGRRCAVRARRSA